MIVAIVLLSLLAVAAATDLRRQKIYNWITYPGILAALGLNALASLLEGGQSTDPGTLASWGLIGIAASLAGMLTCGLVLLVCYVLLKVGGGDVKLMAMIGAFLGPEQGIEAMLWAFMFGGCLGVVWLVWRSGPRRLAAGPLWYVAGALRLDPARALTPEEWARLRPPLYLAPSALAAAVLMQFSMLGWLEQRMGF
jgi:prepilin peptidase CpaA